MALLNPPEILPPLIRSILEYVGAQQGPVNQTDLVDRLSPGHPDDSGSLGRADKAHVRHSAAAARTLGLLTSADGDAALVTEQVRDSMHRGSLRGEWPGLLRRALLEHPDGANAVQEAAEQNTSGPRDLLFAVTWFLAQDAFDAPARWEGADGYRSLQQLQQEQFGAVTKRFPVQNDTRYGAFERWSVHLGLARLDEVSGRGLRPTPTDAVVSALAGLPSGRWEIEEFCRELATKVPCLWPGELRRQLVEVLGSDPDPDVQQGGIDSSVALALVTAERQGLIRLENLADARRRQVLAPGSENARGVTHVEVLR